jgi:formate hydrogenlyase transcriptional activator
MAPIAPNDDALLEVVASIMAQSTLDGLFEELTARLSRFVRFERLVLLLHEPENELVRVAGFYSSLPHRIQLGFALPMDQTPAGEVIREQKIHYLSDTASDDYPQLMPLLREDNLRAMLHLPLTSPSGPVGALAVATVSEHRYTHAEISLLERAMKPVAIAVENILHREQIEAERQRLSIVLELNNAVASKLDPRALFDEFSARLQTIIAHDYLALTEWHPDEKQLRFRAVALRQPIAVSEGQIVPQDAAPSGLAFEQQATLVFNERSLQTMAPHIRHATLNAGIRSVCSLPLTTPRARLGAVSIGSRIPGAFSAGIVAILEAFAAQLAIALENAISFDRIEALNRRLNEAKLYLEEEIEEVLPSSEILGRSPALRKVLQQIDTVAATDATVLIHGETGSGKELVARAIHHRSPRSHGSFVKLNCAAIPSGLLESELFGHEKGAFTGAISQKLGRFEVAHQGTLFLDEVGEIPLDLQPKLLRVLQDREFERLGSSRTLRSDARLVAATNRDLKQMAEANLFRPDLYYRLNVFPIFVPPLRDRREDIPLLAMHFAKEYSRRFGRWITSIPSEDLDILVRYHWPGNIRELQNLIERSVILTRGETLHIPLHELSEPPPPSQVERSGEAPSGTMEEIERDTIRRALREANGVVGGPNGAAARLGMKRTTLLYRMEKLGIDR